MTEMMPANSVRSCYRRYNVFCILTALDVATKPADLNLPAYRLHPLKGDYAGYYSVSVSGNWRIVFRFDGKAPTDIDLVDYH